MVLYLEEMKFYVIHPSILDTYFPFPEVKLRGKVKLEVFEE